MSDFWSSVLTTSDSLEKLIAYMYIRKQNMWQLPRLLKVDWWEAVMKDDYQFKFGFYGDTGGIPVMAIRLTINKLVDVIEYGHNTKKWEEYDGYLMSRWTTNRMRSLYPTDEVVFKALYDSISNRQDMSSCFKNAFKKYRDPRWDQENMLSDIEHIFCKITLKDLDLLEDPNIIEILNDTVWSHDDGEGCHPGYGLQIAHNVDKWKALFGFFFVLHRYELDGSC
jgi:hypothetical protein